MNIIGKCGAVEGLWGFCDSKLMPAYGLYAETEALMEDLWSQLVKGVLLREVSI